MLRILPRAFGTTPRSGNRALSALADAFYDEDQKSLQRTLLKIIQDDINPYVDEWERAGQYPAKQVFQKLGKAGLLGINKPVEYGGQGLSFKFQVAFQEALGNINCGSIPMSVAVQTDMATPALAKFGSHELKKEFLEPSIRGELVSAIGVSEPGAGSDVASVKTTAKVDGDDLVINGQKMWITNAVQADWICLLVNTEDTKSIHSNKSLVVVPMALPGITVAKTIDKMGMRSSDTGIIHFEDVRVPKKNIIGDPGMGFTYQMLQFQEERLAGAAVALMPMDNAIDYTIDYLRERKVFGKPLIDNQYIHYKLAEYKTDVEMLRAGVYCATNHFTSGENVTELATMVKLKAGRLSREVIDGCLQFWGGMGFTNDVLISRFYRDMRVVSIGGGSDETMLGILSKLMGTLPKKG